VVFTPQVTVYTSQAIQLCCAENYHLC